MKKTILIIALTVISTSVFSQVKQPVKQANADTIVLTKDQAIKILNLIQIANKGLAHSSEITAAELTYITTEGKVLFPVIFKRFFNADGSPKK